jgi:hypothetical protein
VGHTQRTPRRGGSFYFRITTGIVLSLALTLLVWIINFFRR